MRTRLGFTVVEMVVASAIAVLAIGGMIAVYLSIGKMTQAGDLSSTLQEAALAMATIQQDLAQARPEGGRGPVVRGAKGGFELTQWSLEPGGAVAPVKVRYSLEKTATGRMRVRRERGRESRLLAGLYRSIRFEQLEGAGGPFVRVFLTACSHDLKGDRPVGAAEETVMTTLVRTAAPELVASKLLNADLGR